MYRAEESKARPGDLPDDSSKPVNAMKIAELAGARVLVVDPVDAASRSFYEHFGFCKLGGTGRMALKLPTGPGGPGGPCRFLHVSGV